MTATAADAVVIAPAARLRGRLRVPGDKSISHRALLLGGMAVGRSVVTGASDALDPRSTADCLRALGVTIEDDVDAEGQATYRIDSPGLAGWRVPADTLDCGNSGTTLRLLTGILAGADVSATLDGDASLHGRPVARVVAPLQAMGARVRARDGDRWPPVTIESGARLSGIDHTSAVPSAQVKSALLLAGLSAAGTTTVRETVATRDHTERMLRARGVDVSTTAVDGGGAVIGLDGGQRIQAADEQVAGDVSAAMFWLVVGACHPDAELTLAGVGVNPTRRTGIDLLRAMGADIEEQPLPPGRNGSGAAAGDPGAVVGGGSADVGEPLADLAIRSSRLAAIEIGPTDVAAAIDEIPLLALAAACARGTTRIRAAGELRHKESDRLTGVAEGLNAIGARVTIDGDDLVIEGGAMLPGHGLRGGEVRALGDHRLAMTFALAGLLAAAPVRLDGGSAAVSYPRFFGDLERIRA